jgi:large subunit ribosomal protein L18e
VYVIFMSIEQKNLQLHTVIVALKKIAIEHEAPVWKRIALELERPCRNTRAVNVARISRYTTQGDIVIVPGKVLATGELAHSVTVAAYAFSSEAARKINAKGKTESILDLAKKNPKGTNIKIIG